MENFLTGGSVTTRDNDVDQWIDQVGRHYLTSRARAFCVQGQPHGHRCGAVRLRTRGHRMTWLAITWLAFGAFFLEMVARAPLIDEAECL